MMDRRGELREVGQCGVDIASQGLLPVLVLGGLHQLRPSIAPGHAGYFQHSFG